MDDPKARFDALLAKAEDPNPSDLIEPLQEDLEELQQPYRIFQSDVDLPRLALLAGALRDYGLWRRIVRYLTEEDGAHRLNQKVTGTPKEDLGPHASDERSAKWVLSKAKRVELPEPARARIHGVLEEFERRFEQSLREGTDDEDEEPEYAAFF